MGVNISMCLMQTVPHCGGMTVLGQGTGGVCGKTWWREELEGVWVEPG